MLKTIYISIFLLAFQSGLAQKLRFEAAFSNQEIPQVPTALFQDSKGFIWIGTTDGVFRYDGNQVLEFRHAPTDTNSISNNFILEIQEDSHGNIWFGSRFGLNRYNPHTEKIKRFLNLDGKFESNENYIHSIIEDHKGRIWYGTYNGLFQLNPKTGERQQFLPDKEQTQTLSNKLVWKVFEDSSHRIWACTHEGFTVFKNDDTYKFQPYYGDYNAPLGLTTDRVFDIIEQSDNSIWLSSYNGIFKVIENRDSFQFQHIHYDKDQPNSLSDNRIFSFSSGGPNKIWAGTWAGGLNELILPSSLSEPMKIVHHRHDAGNEESISMDRVEALMTDQSGVLWVGTGSQIDKVSFSTSKFQSLEANSENANSLTNNIIKSIFKDSFGNLWIGTYNGLNFLSAENFKNKNFTFEQFKQESDNPFSISHNNINGISEDSQGYLWISSFYGLNYIHIPTFLKDKKFNAFTDEHDIPHTINSSVKEIKAGLYWVATNGGLARMSFNPQHPESVKFETFKHQDGKTGSIINTHTNDIIQDKFGSYWIGTFNGISKYVEKDETTFFENYIHELGKPESLSNNSFRCFFKDSENRIWIGTRSGLNLIQQENENERATFKVYGLKDGFPNDVIHAIEEDHKGQLWISTNKGLVVFNPSKDQPVLKVYNSNDGLNASSFVFRSSFKDESGKLYFGTAKGLNYFDPSILPKNTFVPPVYFTKLKILDKVVQPESNTSAILQESITYTKTITLKHWQNIINIEFAALDFNKPQNNQYQYRLSSLNSDWVSLGNNNSVSFTNLAPGKHTLDVKGSNNDGVWNEVPASLIIKVLPPIWKTWWAYSLYLLALIGIIYGIIQFRIRQKVNKIKTIAKIEKAKKEERELLRKKNAEDFHDELGHRFTKISLFLELAQRHSNSENSIKEYLNKIKSNAAGLSEGVRDLIWSLDPTKDSMLQTLTRLQEFGDNLFEFSTIHFKTTGLDHNLEKMELAPDVRKNILMLFKEAMNNCLKYSKAKNAVLSTKSNTDFIYIIFQDDGKGFDSYQSNGYGLKNMKSRAKSIHGAIDILSEKEKGTKITLKIKLNIPHMG